MVRACGLSAVQLALEPLRSGAWEETGAIEALKRAGVGIVSGMMETAGEDYSTLESIKRSGGVRPDEHWEENRIRASGVAAVAARLGLRLVTFHAGFLPHEPGDPLRARMVQRLRDVADVFAAAGITLGLETGQEDAATLVGVLDEVARPNVGVNFDPANMILYGMGDPVASVRTLLPRVVQAHAKDAIRAARPGEWGTEVPVGDGSVDWPEFLGLLRKAPQQPRLVIEREAGDRRIEDVKAAVEVLRSQGWGRR